MSKTILITPSEIVDKVDKRESIPDEMIGAFNTMIATNWNGRRSAFKQDDVVQLIVERCVGLITSDDEIFDRHWLDVEDIYRQAGWTVKYDQPAYCETYPATFEFKPKIKE
jgi:hypothetical protein